MSEKLFKTVEAAGVWNLVLGIVLLVTGIVSGVALLVNGGKLLRDKRSITF